MRHHKITPRLLALGKDTSWALIEHFGLEIPLPRHSTELVATGQLDSPTVFVFWVELHVHDLAVVLVLLSGTFVDIIVLLSKSSIKLNPNLMAQLLAIGVPLVLDLTQVPVEVSQHRNGLLLIETQELLGSRNKLWDPTRDLAKLDYFV